MSSFAETGGGLAPTEDLLDAFSEDLADRVAGMAGRAPVDRRAPPSARRAGRRSSRAFLDEVVGVVARVGPSVTGPAGRRAARSCGAPPYARRGRDRRRQASTTRPLRFSIRAWPMKQSCASAPGPCGTAWRRGRSCSREWRLREPRHGSRARRSARRRRSPEPSLGRKLFIGPRFDQRAIDVKCSLESSAPTFGWARMAARNSCATSPSSRRSRFLPEARRVPRRVVDAQPDEPAEQKVEVDPLHQLALGADAVERLQQQRPKQPFRRDRRAADIGGVDRVENSPEIGRAPR